MLGFHSVLWEEGLGEAWLFGSWLAVWLRDSRLTVDFKHLKLATCSFIFGMGCKSLLKGANPLRGWLS